MLARKLMDMIKFRWSKCLFDILLKLENVSRSFLYPACETSFQQNKLKESP